MVVHFINSGLINLDELHFMYKTIWDKRVHLLLSTISTTCRGLRWQQDLLRKILSFTHSYPYGIDVDWGILEMMGSHQIKLENDTNRAHWKDVTMQ